MFLGGTWHAVGLQAAAGFAVFFGIQRFFKEVDEKLNDDTRLEIAVWLPGVKVRPKIRLSPDTIASVLDRVFGKNTLSWRCFWRTCLLSNIMTSLVVIIKALANVRELKNDPTLVLVAVLVIFFLFFLNGAMGFMLLMETRRILGLLRRWNFPVLWSLLLIVDAIFTLFLTLFTMLLPTLWMGAAIPAVLTSVVLWLYVAAGLLIKGARRFDIFVDFMNSRLDIEKKPLQSVGLVGAFFATAVYWACVSVFSIWERHGI